MNFTRRAVRDKIEIMAAPEIFLVYFCAREGKRVLLEELFSTRVQEQAIDLAINDYLEFVNEDLEKGEAPLCTSDIAVLTIHKGWIIGVPIKRGDGINFKMGPWVEVHRGLIH